MADKPLGDLNTVDILNALKVQALWKKIGDAAVKNMQTRIRLGFAVATNNGAQGKFKALAPSTVSKRKKLSDLSQQTSAKKSNLTETGQLVDAISFRATGGTVQVFIEDNGRNHKIADLVSPERPFFNLSATEVSRLIDIVETAIDTYIRTRT